MQVQEEVSSRDDDMRQMIRDCRSRTRLEISGKAPSQVGAIPRVRARAVPECRRVGHWNGEDIAAHFLRVHGGEDIKDGANAFELIAVYPCRDYERLPRLATANQEYGQG